MSFTYDAALDRLNNLQSNFQVLNAQKKGEFKKDHPKVIFKRHKKLLDEIDGGKLKQRLAQIPLVHIAGTKGKGSTSAFTESILRAKGYKTGLFTSPHLVSVCERIRINGRPIAPEKFAKNFETVFNSICGPEPDQPPPAYFSFLTFVALHTFAAENVDVIILEVGIGGRYCATSIYPPVTSASPTRTTRVCCITALGFDHISVLGSKIEQIAWAKAGIFRDRSVLISSPQRIPGAEAVLRKEANRYNSNFLISDQSMVPAGIDLGIIGECQRENAATAIAAVRALMGTAVTDPLDDMEINALVNTYWPGRSQKISHTLPDSRTISVYMDAAHTEDSTNQCVKWMDNMNVPELGIIFNITGERDEKTILTALAKLKPIHIFLTPNRAYDQVLKDQENRNNPMSKQMEKLGQIESTIVREMKLNCSVSCHSSMSNVLNNIPSKINNILITGSVHLIGSFFALRPDLPV